MARTQDFTEVLIDWVDGRFRQARFSNMWMGGGPGPEGGSSYRPIDGQLTQRHISYDTSEPASPCSPSGFSSLVDNLRRMRYWQEPATWFGVETTSGLQVTIKPGLWYPSTTEYCAFAGGNSPTFTLPGVLDRIDTVYVDPSGILHIQQGTPAVTPTITLPAITEGIPLWAVYLTPTASGIYHPSCSGYYPGQGYIERDLRPFLNLGGGGTIASGTVYPATEEGQALVSNAALEWIADTTPTWLGTHTWVSTVAPQLDLNPGFVGTGRVIDITPTAAISTIGANWDGIHIDGAALDPSVVDVDIHGIHIDVSGILTTNLPHIDTLHIQTPAGYHRETNHALHTEGGGIWMDFDADTITILDRFTVNNIVIDIGAATVGMVHAYDVAIAGTGTVPVAALGTHSGVDPIHQHIGAFAASQKAWEENGGFTDATAAFAGAPNVEIFSGDNDYIYISGTAPTVAFDEIQVVLTVDATKSIKPVFEFSTGGPGWTQFYPADDTNGFQQDGTIRFSSTDLITAGWAVQNVNAEGVNRFWIRIQRTRNNVGTPPTESTIKVLAVTGYYWDKDGVVSVNKVGIGTTAVPHGGVGVAKFAIEGTDVSEDGPHVQITTDSDDYPLLQILANKHDGIHLSFDAYYDYVSWKSSDGGSNCMLHKEDDYLQISYDGNVVAGNAITWNTGLVMKLTNGMVGIGESIPGGKLDVAWGGTGTYMTLQLGACTSSSARTNVTNKYVHMGAYHYTNIEKPIGMMYVASTNIVSRLDIGGGSGLLNAATRVSIYAAANTTTATGTEILRVTSSYFLIDQGATGVNIGLGTPTPGCNLELHAAAGTNAAFWLSDADVNHSFTGIGFVPEIQADVLGAIINAAGAEGGVQFLGFTDDDVTPFYLYGHIGDAAPANPAVIIGGWKTDGAVGRTALAAAEIVLQIHNGAGVLATTLGNGDLGLGLSPAYKLDLLDDNANDFVAQMFNDGDNVNRNVLLLRGGGEGADVGTTYFLYCSDHANAPTGCLKTVNGVFSLQDLSDEGRKANIVDTKVNGLDVVKGLRVRDYNWKANPDGPVMTSFVAQEAQEVYPAMVGEFRNGELGTSRGMLIPILTKAIQELDERLVKLELSD